ncbi:MAG: efflux RND transporter periplasmic adaptor subunit [Bacteroidia bacterium]|nr:efflux RND transporter periplasmic adaptor subunit [Bacteroidia bacterium]
MAKGDKQFIKYAIIGLVVVVVLLLVAKKMGWVGGDKATDVSVEEVSERTITEIVSANGNVQPEVEVKISADVSGEIVELNVKEGQKVKKGMLLVKVDPDIYLSSVDRVAAALNTQKANLENSKSRATQSEAQFLKTELQFKRNEKLFKDGTISKAEFEEIETAYLVSRAEMEAGKQSVRAAEFNVQSSMATLKEARKNLNKTSIYAPVDGTISRLNVELGERVVGTAQMAGTEIMRIANLSEMEVNADVGESDIIRVNIGDTAEIEVDAYLEEKFIGIVTEIANSANVSGMSTEQVTNFPVKIRILRVSYNDLMEKQGTGKSPFRPGMSSTVEITTNKVHDVLTAPIQAVATRDTTIKSSRERFKKKKEEENNSSEDEEENMKEIVFVVDGGEVKMQVVKTGIQDNTYIEILEGLKEGQEVVSGPYRAISKTLNDGDDVTVVDKEDLFKEKKK